MGNEAIILFIILGLLMVGGAFIVSYLISPKQASPLKDETYECGIQTIGSSWIQFKVGYYLFAILFLIFDVETIFIVPWAVVMKKIGLVAFIEILIFFLILGLGLIYAWKKRALQWE
ncbi:MAG TPA: NADH-quinone oxidoreductase subunit A [Flammeovirgaceae bacterium]|nr:NADH-quinone oxidoreductase subunit A [Flammeovirgaceae bacterium]